MKLLALVLGLACVAAALSSCASDPAPSGDPDASGVTTYTGVLRGGMSAIGGETTGWVLARDGSGGTIDIDVSNARPDAEAYQGRRVTVTGKLTQRRYVERGVTRILVADKIEKAR